MVEFRTVFNPSELDSTPAILLRKFKLTETSLIVTWFTETHGKLKTVAKGARRPKSPFAGRLDLFFNAEITLARSAKSELHALREVVVTDSREGLRLSYERTCLAAYFVELVEMTTEPDHPAPEIYDLLRRALDFLARNEPTRRAMLHFERELSRVLGVTGVFNPDAEPAGAIARLTGGNLPPDRARLLASFTAAERKRAAALAT